MQVSQSSAMVTFIVSLLAVEAFGFFVLAAVHLGAPIDVPGYVQARAPAAVVTVGCGVAVAAAAWMAAIRRDSAWEMGIGAQVACVAGMLVLDNVLAVTDVTPVYRIGIAAAGAIGILMMTAPAKSALGREVRADARRGR